VDFWTNKFAENVARDVRQRHALEQAGWRVLTIWECETLKPVRLLALAEALSAASPVGRN
jgi:DNA mismatch endonuclease (patch repair protein)